MKSFLKNREEVLQETYQEIFSSYPKEQIYEAVRSVLKTVMKKENIPSEILSNALDRALSKTETFNTLLTLLELEKRAVWDTQLSNMMKDPSFNQHRAIAINICDMYSSGATSFFGYIDCVFPQLFPGKANKSFLAKGISALISAICEVVASGNIEEHYTEKNLQMLAERGITLNHLSELVLELQKPYNPELELQTCEHHVRQVLRKQQTYHAIKLSFCIDIGVEKKEFGAQFNEIVGNDEGLYGLDETISSSISKMYGMIAITNFGYLDKLKPGIIHELDSDHTDGRCNTYGDDIVCALVAASCARLAHNNASTNSKPS